MNGKRWEISIFWVLKGCIIMKLVIEIDLNLSLFHNASYSTHI